MKLRDICKSKIHHAVVTGADLNYVGSIGIDRALMQATDIAPGEKVSVWNVTNGERIETYAFPLQEGSGEVVINGAAAHQIHGGDKIIIAAFVLTDEVITPRMVVVDARNRILRTLPDHESTDEFNKTLA